MKGLDCQLMSVWGQNRKSGRAIATSALPSTADIRRQRRSRLLGANSGSDRSHSITLSALTSNEGGTERPSTFERSIAASARALKKAAARAAFFLFFVSKGITGRDVAGRPDP
jgi:hypothetical protein